MNGFTENGLSDEAFGQAKGGLSSFDAFRKCAFPEFGSNYAANYFNYHKKKALRYAAAFKPATL